MTQQFIRTSFASIAILVLTPLTALPQKQLPPPPIIPYGMPISIEAAKAAGAAAVAEAKKNNLKMAVAVVDTGGYLVYFEKMTDAQTGSVEVAIGKAKSAALFRRPTKLFQEAVAAGGDGLRILGLTGAVPVDGGVPVIVGGKLIGAVGASGGSSDQDGMVARAGVAGVK